MALDPVTLSFIAKGAVALGSTIGSAFQKSNVNRLKGDAKRLSNQFIDSAKKRLAKNQMDKLSINTAESKRRLDEIQQSLAQLNLGGGDQRTVGPDAARQFVLGTKAAAAENARNRKRVEQLDLLSAQEDSAIAGEIANIELAQGIQERKDLAQLNRMESEANKAMFKGLADIGTAAFGAATGPEAIARRQAKKAFDTFNQAAEGQGVDYMGSIVRQMGKYDPNDPAAFLSNLEIANPALKTALQNPEFAQGLQALYAGGSPTTDQLQDFLTSNLDQATLQGLGSVDASTSPFIGPEAMKINQMAAAVAPEYAPEMSSLTPMSAIQPEGIDPMFQGVDQPNLQTPLVVSPEMAAALFQSDDDDAAFQQQQDFLDERIFRPQRLQPMANTTGFMLDPFGVPNYLLNY